MSQIKTVIIKYSSHDATVQLKILVWLVPSILRSCKSIHKEYVESKDKDFLQ